MRCNVKVGLIEVFVALKVSVEALPFYDRIAGEEISRISVLLHRSTYETQDRFSKRAWSC